MKTNKISEFLIRITLAVFVGVTLGICDQGNGKLSNLEIMAGGLKYDGDGFTLYPSRFVVHYQDGDFTYKIQADDKNVVEQLIRTIKNVEKTQLPEWPTIQRKIMLCNGDECNDTLILNVQKDDSLSVVAAIGGEHFDLVQYFADNSITLTRIILIVVSTCSVWGGILVGLTGFIMQRRKRKKQKDIPVYSASRNSEEGV